VDIWALGVIAFMLLCGSPPFTGFPNNYTRNVGDQDDMVLFERICGGLYEFFSPDWDLVQQIAKDFVKATLIVNVVERPTATELQNHGWLSQVDQELPTEIPLRVSEAERAVARQLDKIRTQSKQLRESRKAKATSC